MVVKAINHFIRNSLEDVQSIMIGVRNKTNHEVSAEVWVNELRLSQFNEQGGVAAMANAADTSPKSTL